MIFTKTATVIIATETEVYSGVTGLITFFTDSIREVSPAYKMMIAITRAVRYSARPCPKGCFLSAGFPASFVPMIVITEERASLKLFTLSSIIAIELDKKPTKALKAARAIFAEIPVILALTIMFSRSFSVIFSLRFWKKYRIYQEF